VMGFLRQRPGRGGGGESTPEDHCPGRPAAGAGGCPAPAGDRLWQCPAIGPAPPKGATVSASYRALTAGETVVVQRDRAFYAFPVA
ncbi:hypothetical protein ACFWQA_33505, partial [Streptomyces anulatus]